MMPNYLFTTHLIIYLLSVRVGCGGQICEHVAHTERRGIDLSAFELMGRHYLPRISSRIIYTTDCASV